MTENKNFQTEFLNVSKALPAFLVLMMLFSFFNGFTQHTNIKLEKPADTKYFATPCEPSLVINPFNTDQMIAGAVLDALYTSSDGGKTWNTEVLKSTAGVEGDPCIIVDKKGCFHYFHLSNPPSGVRFSSIVHQKLESFGGGWSTGTAIGEKIKKLHDKEWAVSDMQNGNLYLSWTIFDEYKSTDAKNKTNIFFSSSTDYGTTWSKPLQVSTIAGDCKDDDNSLEGSMPVVGPAGEIYLVWVGLEKIYLNRSDDFGKTWLKKEKAIFDQRGGWRIEIPGIYRYSGFPIIQCDTTNSPRRGNLYLTWSECVPGTSHTRILFARSKDKGESWTEPLIIGSDSLQKHSFFPWMTVDQKTGNIYIVYYDRRNFNDNHTEVFLAWSDDGGNTFRDFKISESAFIPDKEMFFGDYAAVAAYNNVVRPVWTRLDGFSLSLWTAIIDMNYLGTDHSLEKRIITGEEDGLTITDSWNLEDEPRKTINNIYDDWFKNIYRPALPGFNIKMNCGDCVYAYMDVVFYISDKGKIVRYVVEKENFCAKNADEKLKTKLLDYFLNYTFPVELRNKAVRMKLGTGLKC
ncbi:MAG: hypothetical protein A2W91_01970 [Bacteroidetes bacterium GWF2_38_335]|nr:MAG: hypothetical protein A2W91_01970 [Bacteroidetes bacterium GWF2_38_335]OFY80620.1 MAG: hypothetical protein A2281_04985 [Bacteroidetes bacterium RIFOXYA12_FULL_38_20]HBS86960.1 glycosyl hydrolase [Bacteroidales bacterium]